MGNSNGKITAPVSIEDVCQVLGVTTRDVGYLCSNAHGKINMWSRYKPVHIANKIDVDRNSLYYRGTELDCGIIPRSTVSYRSIPDLYNNGNSEWNYKPPVGGSSSPYRLLDFYKYKHDATPALSSFFCPDKVPQNGTFTCSLLLNADVEDQYYIESGSLSLREITIYGKNLSNWYFGGVITDINGNIKFFASGNKISDGTFSHNFPIFSTNSLTLGDMYYIYPYMSKNPKEQDGDDSENLFITLPKSTRIKFQVVSSTELDGVNINIYAEYIYSNNNKVKITGSFTVECEKLSKTFNNNYLSCRFNSEESPLQYGEYHTELANFTVNGKGGTYTYPFSFNILSGYENKMYYILLTLSSSKYRKKTFPEEQDISPIII